MKATVCGVVARLGTPVAVRSRSGRFVGAYAVDDYALELGDADIDLDHEGETVGQVVYAEVTPENQLAAVGVVDDDTLAKTGRPIFWSGSYMPDDDHGFRERSAVVPRAKVLGLALTLESANSSARAVGWMPGDVRLSGDRSSWPISWRSSHPLLARALDHVGTDSRARTRSASRIVDRRDNGDYPWHLLPDQAWRQASPRPTGPWRYRPGRILSVR